MDLNEIAVFIKVVQSGSFSGAARALNLPNSTVSFKISSLEKRLGITLIQRTTRKLNITPLGEAYYKRCLISLEEINAAEAEITSIQSEPQGLLRITAPIDIGSNVLPIIVSSYMKKFPKVRVEVILSDRRVDLLSESVDLAIRAGELKDSTLIAKRVGSTYFIMVASAKYLKLNGIPTHPRELIKHKCLQFTSNGVDTWKLVGPKGSLNVSVPGRVLVNHFEMIKLMASMDDGIAYLPITAVHEELKSGKLIRVLPEWRSELAPVHFVYPAQKFVTPKLSSFIEHANAALKEKFKNIFV